MIVVNQQNVTAIVIRHDGRQVTLVPMRVGKLGAQRFPVARFHSDWKVAEYSLQKTLEVFLKHADAQGASKEVVDGLQRLQQRDRDMVASLF